MKTHTFIYMLLFAVFIVSICSFFRSQINMELIDRLIKTQAATTRSVLSLSENQSLIIDELTKK